MSTSTGPRMRLSLLLISLVGALLLLAGCAVPSDPATAGGDGTDSAAPEEAAADGPPRDGQFEFTVGDVDCSRSVLGDEFFQENAQGVFCIIQVGVENIGDEPRMFEASTQSAFDGEGRTYQADSGLVSYLEDGGTAFLNNINPGNSVDAQLVFDVPEGTQLTRLQLHDDFLSGGVEVPLQ